MWIILEVGKPEGEPSGVLDDRRYKVKAVNEDGDEVVVYPSVCLTRRSIQLMLDREGSKKLKTPNVLVGDILE